MEYWLSVYKRNREIKYFKCKFISYEKVYKKTKNKTFNNINRWK